MTKSKKGYMLIEILLVVAVIALLSFSGFYFNSATTQNTQIENGINAEKKAQEVINKINLQNQNQQDTLNALNQKVTSTPLQKIPN